MGASQLFPVSDIDVLLLLPRSTEAHAHLKTHLERFIGACWDAGLEIRLQRAHHQRMFGPGAARRYRANCHAGVTPHSRRTKLCLPTFNSSTAALSEPQGILYWAKTLELRQRHIKYEDTPYALKPNCKESPGGLRDLHTILWVAKAPGLGHTWQELAHPASLPTLKPQQLERNETTLSLIRAKLHAIAGRHEDRLVFDLQTAVAPVPGPSRATPRWAQDCPCVPARC